jgi:hypothetical protein
MYYRDGRVMSNFIIAALKNQNLTIYGDGSYTRCHMHVKDLVEAVDLLAKKPFGYIGPVNVGSVKEITVKELADIVIRMTGSKSSIVHDKELTGDPKFRKPNISKARKDLGWEPKVALEEGMRDTIDHYKQLGTPDKKIIVFTTTYYPDMGPAERAIMEMTSFMPDTEFYIITTKSRKNLPDYEMVGNNFIFRLGSGNILGKYFFPVRGALKAFELTRKYNFRFAWSAMASYGGLAAVILKMMNKKINFLLTFDKSESDKKGFLRKILYLPLYKLIFKNADSIYLTNEQTREKALTLHSKSNTAIMKWDEDLAAQIDKNYSALLDKQENKLARPL